MSSVLVRVRKVTKKAGFEEATRKVNTGIVADSDGWEEHEFGTASLAEIWEMTW